MRYAIGCEMKAKEARYNKKDCNGIYTFDSLGFPYILTEDSVKESKQIHLPVFETAEEAKNYAQRLARSFRRDDVAFQEGKSKFIRNFYPVKIDSLNFPYVITIESSIKYTQEKDRFGKDVKSSPYSYNSVYAVFTKKDKSKV